MSSVISTSGRDILFFGWARVRRRNVVCGSANSPGGPRSKLVEARAARFPSPTGDLGAAEGLGPRRLARTSLRLSGRLDSEVLTELTAGCAFPDGAGQPGNLVVQFVGIVEVLGFAAGEVDNECPRFVGDDRVAARTQVSSTAATPSRSRRIQH